MKRELMPKLGLGEEIIFYSQGGYVNNLRSAWRLGHLYLTNRRIFFFQPVGIIFETAFENIVEVRSDRRRYAFREKEVIFMAYKHEKANIVLNAWIIMADLETWKKKIYERTSLVVDEEKIDKVMNELDPASQEILKYIWYNRHARINELAEISQAASHMEVLLKIKETINPTSEKIIGAPLLVFERLKVDEATGEKVGFSWWILGQRAGEAKRDTIMDVFDEGDRIIIIMEILGVKEEDILVDVDKGRVIITASGTVRDYYEEVVLDRVVNTESMSKRYKNGILQVNLTKSGLVNRQI